MADVLLGVTGSIAAYRACDVVREFRRRGHGVRVVMTRAAEAFVSKMTFEALAGSRVATHELEQPEEWSIEHISLARKSAALVVAPATADILGKFAHGVADDFLTTLYLAFEGPVFVAPAMNPSMWKHPAVRENCEILKKRGVKFISPADGLMACGEEGTGKLAAVEAVVASVEHGIAKGNLAGKRVVVTAGPTAETIDAARVISSLSTGRMGFALADVAYRRGADVVLIAGPTALAPPPGAEVVRIKTGEEMLAALKKHLPKADVLAMAAAVSDMRPKVVSAAKIKKDKLPSSMDFTPTKDLLKETAALRKNVWTLGFAAEDSSVLEREAARKLKDKKLDAIFANPISKAGVGFASEENEGVLLFASGKRVEVKRAGKGAVAERVWDEAERALAS